MSAYTVNIKPDRQGYITKGAHCIIQWHDSKLEEEQYISFGEYNPDINEDFDSLGQRDDTIFWYCEGGLDELKGFMDQYMSVSHEAFTVKSYQLLRGVTA